VAVKGTSDNQGPSMEALEEQGRAMLENVMAASRLEKTQGNTITGSTRSLNTTDMSLSSLEGKPCSNPSALANRVPVSQAPKSVFGINQVCQTCGPLQAHLRPAHRIL
jgi:hypothetical protein